MDVLEINNVYKSNIYIGIIDNIHNIFLLFTALHVISKRSTKCVIILNKKYLIPLKMSNIYVFLKVLIF